MALFESDSKESVDDFAYESNECDRYETHWGDCYCEEDDVYQVWEESHDHDCVDEALVSQYEKEGEGEGMRRVLKELNVDNFILNKKHNFETMIPPLPPTP